MQASGHRSLSFLRVAGRPPPLTQLDAQPCAAAGPLLVVLTDQQREDGGQQHEDHRLDEPDQQLHEIERDRQQPSQARHDRRHGLEHVLAGEDVAVEPKAE